MSRKLAAEREEVKGYYSEDDMDDDDEGSIYLDDEEDFDDELLSDEFNEGDNLSYGGEENLSKGVDLDDLQTYHNKHFGVELNASTADFNKEIKQINQQLLNEGHIKASDSTSLEKPVLTKTVATYSPAGLQKEPELKGQESVTDLQLQMSGSLSTDQIDT